MEEKQVAIRFEHITKRFGEVVANNDVTFDVYKGEILSILGENGSGKTSLLNALAGFYFPDNGKIYINGEEAQIHSPKEAYIYKIGMVHQHFKLVDVFSGTDNILLGEGRKYYSLRKAYGKIKKKKKEAYAGKSFIKKVGLWFKFLPDYIPPIGNKLGASMGYLYKQRGKTTREIAAKYGFDINLNKKVYSMSVSEKQTVEIIKVLYRGAEILVLDEPTAVLTPQEITKLFDVMRKMREDGKTILIITHKLNEVMEISDRVAILRKGEYIGTVNTSETNESQLTEMMVGKKVELNIKREQPKNVQTRLKVVNYCNKNDFGVKILENVSFEARTGEILGIAGIAGSGQRQLLEAIAGLQRHATGDILYIDPNTNEEINLEKLTAGEIRDLGVRLSFVPEDRLGMGLVGNMNLVDNTMLRSYRKGKGVFLHRKEPRELTEQMVERLHVATPNLNTEVKKLSGGNVQKVLVGREISSSPTVLMVAYPVRGLDINSSYLIYDLINEQKEKGAAVIFVGEDIDVLLAICDRLMVISGGEVTGFVDPRVATKEEVGLLMLKNSHKGDEING